MSFPGNIYFHICISSLTDGTPWQPLITITLRAGNPNYMIAENIFDIISAGSGGGDVTLDGREAYRIHSNNKEYKSLFSELLNEISNDYEIKPSMWLEFWLTKDE